MIEDCLEIPVSVPKALLLGGGDSDTGSFTWKGARRTHQLFFRLAKFDGRTFFFYKWEPGWEPGRDQGCAVQIEILEWNLGGRRYFFRCGCGHRVTKLYLPYYYLNGTLRPFLCRHCLPGFRYTSRREAPRQRMWRSYHELCAELMIPGLSGKRLQKIVAKLEDVSAAVGLQTGRLTERLEKASHVGTGQLEGGLAEVDSEQAGTRIKRTPGRPRTKRRYDRHSAMALSAPTGPNHAYCPKCRDRREMDDTSIVTFANGRKALRGRCGMCHSVTSRIVDSGANDLAGSERGRSS
jgi:Domain of unknown function (DUF5679)